MSLSQRSLFDFDFAANSAFHRQFGFGNPPGRRRLFPAKKLGIRKIGFTYSLMNLIVPFFGGIPVCHGSGGMVGHYTFGGRTGGSIVTYGTMYLVLGLFFSYVFGEAILLFPKPMLGVILLFEGWALMKLTKI